MSNKITQKKSVNYNSLFKNLLTGILLIQSFLFIFFILTNITALPEYGDTFEYLNIENNLKLNDYREVLYPLIVNFFYNIYY